jgi:hypothetical protein
LYTQWAKWHLYDTKTSFYLHISQHESLLTRQCTQRTHYFTNQHFKSFPVQDDIFH